MSARSRKCSGERGTCPVPAVTLTPHGAYCQAHRPGTPPVPEPEGDGIPYDAMLVLAQAGWTPIWSVPTPSAKGYGPDAPSRPMILTHPRDRGRGEQLDPRDDRAPVNARRAAQAGLATGWAVKLTLVAGNVLLRARRHPFRLAASWTDGAFDGGWLQVPGALPSRLTYTQVRAFLAGAP